MKRKKAMGGTSSSSSRTAASETETAASETETAATETETAATETETAASETETAASETETAASETETAASRLFSVPMEILEKLFLNLPPEEVVCTCRLVCRQWKEMADSEYLWTERCRRESYHLRDVSRTPKDWRLFYFLCKKRRNLLKNPREEDQLLGWKILEKVYDKSSNSYYFCKKSQLIDLEREGYNPEFMDHFQPDIKISDWYAPRWDCPSQYEICVELLNQKKKPVHTFAPETIVFGPWNIGIWHQMTHVFQNYGPGVRYIRFTHGRDKSKYWGGWYGLRITDSCVEICPSVETQ